MDQKRDEIEIQGRAPGAPRISGASAMSSAVYRIVPYQEGWGVAHDGSTTGPYATKEAAFEATAAAARASRCAKAMRSRSARQAARWTGWRRCSKDAGDAALGTPVLSDFARRRGARLHRHARPAQPAIAKVLFAIFVVLFLLFLILGIMAGEALFR